MLVESLKLLSEWRSWLDIFLVAFIVYQILLLLKGTRAAQILVGLLFIFLAYLISGFLQLETIHWLISKFYASFIVMIIVLFQEDIRRILTQFWKKPFFSGMQVEDGHRVIREVLAAVDTLSHERIGALIVFERSVALNRLYDHNVVLDAHISEQLLMSIFQSFSPLHDGAVIIQKNKISSASAQLPLSKNPLFAKKFGTRHSAAVGISERTDAVVLVVSEETGNISVVWDGMLQRQPNIQITEHTLKKLLLHNGNGSDEQPTEVQDTENYEEMTASPNIPDDESRLVGQNEALRVVVDPEDRFTPPLPRSKSPKPKKNATEDQ
jgi:uncharacterized protein (TIGR00159 family)